MMNLIFTVFFASEFVFKMAAYRPKVLILSENYFFLFKAFYLVALHFLILQKKLFYTLQEYFRDPWNTFDFVIVIGSFLDIAMANLSEGGAGLSINFFRLFRAMR